MLNYSSDDETAKKVAIFYAKKSNSTLAEDFFAGNKSLSSSVDAIEVAKIFWDMAALAREDYLNNSAVLDDVDIEFWMYKIFNKIQGYYDKNGFVNEWKMIVNPHYDE